MRRHKTSDELCFKVWKFARGHHFNRINVRIKPNSHLGARYQRVWIVKWVLINLPDGWASQWASELASGLERKMFGQRSQWVSHAKVIWIKFPENASSVWKWCFNKMPHFRSFELGFERLWNRRHIKDRISFVRTLNAGTERWKYETFFEIENIWVVPGTDGSRLLRENSKSV